MVLKGFTLLHRDASNGRFAAMRAGGFGSYHRYADAISKIVKNKNSFSEVLPPPKTRFQQLLGKDSDQQSDIVPYHHRARIDDLRVGFADTVGDIFIEFVRNAASNIIGLKTANRLTHLGAPQGW